MILSTQDFKSDYQIAIPRNDVSLEAKYTQIIEQYEKEIMLDLLGRTMYNEILNSTLAGGSNTPSVELEYIFNEFDYEEGCHRLRSNGIVQMLAQMIFFYIDRSGMTGNTPLGSRLPQSEVSSGADTVTLCRIYNQGLKSYNAIQDYISINKSNYPDFKGVCRKTVSFI